jgi:hypothetical protein
VKSPGFAVTVAKVATVCSGRPLTSPTDRVRDLVAAVLIALAKISTIFDARRRSSG